MSQAASHKTVLNDRVLWYDGDSTVNADMLNAIILGNGTMSGLYVEDLTPEHVEFNKLTPKAKQIKVKNEVRPLSLDWDIPDKYKQIDIATYVFDRLYEKFGNYSDITQRELRCVEELALFEKYGLFDTLKALIYIINILVKNDVVWGVGRGSSVSSFVLHVLGVHDVDSFKYDLDITDFLREPIIIGEE